MSANASSSTIAAANAPNTITTTSLDNPVAEGGAVHRIVQAKNETVQHVTVTALVPLYLRWVI
jgi:hypothetical protein